MANLKQTTVDGGLRAWIDDQRDPDLFNTVDLTLDGDQAARGRHTAIAVGGATADEKLHVYGNIKSNDFIGPDGSLQYRLDILENLLPKGPNLEDMTASSGANGRISFGPANPIDGYVNVPGTDINATFNSGGTRRGLVDGAVNGTLNEQVTASDNHGADIFTPGSQGTLELRVNDTVVSTVDLAADAGAIDNRAGGTGFVLSAATPLTFPDGSTFDAVTQRSGNWYVGFADLDAGYNAIQVVHVGFGETTVYEYVADKETGVTITFGAPALANPTTTGAKVRSGVTYNTGASADFTVDIFDVYRNTYASGNAITFPTTTNCSVPSQSIPTMADEADVVNVTATASADVNYIINDGFAVNARITDPLKATATSALATDFAFLVDRTSGNDSNKDNQFNTENYRLTSDSDFDAGNLAGNWDSGISIVDGGAGYNDGLQVIRDQLEYPSINFAAIANGPAGNPNYDGAAGERTFYGYFVDTGQFTSNWAFHIWGNATVVAEAVGFTAGSNQVKISIKLPNDPGYTNTGSGGTAWLDINSDYSYDVDTDGAGAFAATNGNTRNTSGGAWGVTTGERSTAGSYGKIYYRITVPAGWTGNITRISADWL